MALILLGQSRKKKVSTLGSHSYDQMRSISAKHGCSLDVRPCDPALPTENPGGTRGGASMTSVVLQFSGPCCLPQGFKDSK